MNTSKEFRRKIETTNEKRKSRRLSFTDSEYEVIQAKARSEGFDKPRDYISYMINSTEGNLAFAENRYQQAVIKINSLATHINKIESNIDIDNAKNDLVKEVKELCQSYKL